jgi:hypothetical protein
VTTRTTARDVAGPWSPATSHHFWEDFAPAALGSPTGDESLNTVFLDEQDWTPAAASVRQDGRTTHGRQGTPSQLPLLSQPMH